MSSHQPSLTLRPQFLLVRLYMHVSVPVHVDAHTTSHTFTISDRNPILMTLMTALRTPYYRQRCKSCEALATHGVQ